MCCRRVSVVDYRGHVIMDTHIQPMMPVTDYRTAVSGIEARHLSASKCAISKWKYNVYRFPVK